MSKELNDIRKLAGLKPLMESQVEEAMGGQSGNIPISNIKHPRAPNGVGFFYYMYETEEYNGIETDCFCVFNQLTDMRIWARVPMKGPTAEAEAMAKELTIEFQDYYWPEGHPDPRDATRRPVDWLKKSGQVEEEVDHTRYGNESHPQSYDLSSFDNKGRASLKNRYVQSRYGDNPLKNAKQIAREGDATMESLEAEFEAFLAEGYAEECDDTDEDVIHQAKDQLAEINLDEEDQIDEADAVSNFTSDDIKELERIHDLNAAKHKALELITRQTSRSMKPQKVAFFKQAIAAKKSVADIIKLMYDLLLSGEGFGVVGSTGSMRPSAYRKQFGEEEVIEGADKTKSNATENDTIEKIMKLDKKLNTKGISPDDRKKLQADIKTLSAKLPKKK